MNIGQQQDVALIDLISLKSNPQKDSLRHIKNHIILCLPMICIYDIVVICLTVKQNR